MGYLKHIKKCNDFTTKDKIPFMVDSRQVGWIKESYISYLLESHIFVKEGNSITIKSKYDTFESKNRALENFAKQAFQDGISNIFMAESFVARETLNPFAL